MTNYFVATHLKAAGSPDSSLNVHHLMHANKTTAKPPPYRLKIQQKKNRFRSLGSSCQPTLAILPRHTVRGLSTQSPLFRAVCIYASTCENIYTTLFTRVWPPKQRYQQQSEHNFTGRDSAWPWESTCHVDGYSFIQLPG